MADTKKRPRKAAAQNPPDPSDDDDQPDPSDDDDHPTDEESIEALVKRVLAEELPRILGEEEPDDDGDDDKTKTPARRSAADDEGIAYKAIRAAMDRLNREDVTDKRLKQLEEKVIEEAPAQVRRATRLMWGNPERAK